jgi:hypothetical protein
LSKVSFRRWEKLVFHQAQASVVGTTRAAIRRAQKSGPRTRNARDGFTFFLGETGFSIWSLPASAITQDACLEAQRDNALIQSYLADFSFFRLGEQCRDEATAMWDRARRLLQLSAKAYLFE